MLIHRKTIGSVLLDLFILASLLLLAVVTLLALVTALSGCTDVSPPPMRLTAYHHILPNACGDDSPQRHVATVYAVRVPAVYGVGLAVQIDAGDGVWRSGVTDMMGQARIGIPSHLKADIKVRLERNQ